MFVVHLKGGLLSYKVMSLLQHVEKNKQPENMSAIAVRIIALRHALTGEDPVIPYFSIFSC